MKRKSGILMDVHSASRKDQIAKHTQHLPFGSNEQPVERSHLAIFHGLPQTPRLFHYFLPRLIAEGKQVLCLDGANRFDPLLIARFARQRGKEPSQFNRHLRVARAFTCFQLTELLARVPRFLSDLPANVLIVTGMPELYFDEDVRERQAAASFAEALESLRALKPLLLGVGVFSEGSSFQTPRRSFFRRLTAQADHVSRFSEERSNRLTLVSEKADAEQKRVLP